MGELAPADTQRWGFRRKAAVVDAVMSGKVTLEEACRRYPLTEEEFLAWQHTYEEHGPPGLRATRLQQYRTPSPPLTAPGAARRPRSQPFERLPTYQAALVPACCPPRSSRRTATFAAGMGAGSHNL
jgi:transposase-like protein